VWFAVHTLFGTVSERHIYGLRLLVPDWSTIDWAACSVAALALLLTFHWKRGMATTLAVSVAAGALLFYAVT
jgi:chromate transporter